MDSCLYALESANCTDLRESSLCICADIHKFLTCGFSEKVWQIDVIDGVTATSLSDVQYKLDLTQVCWSDYATTSLTQRILDCDLQMAT